MGDNAGAFLEILFLAVIAAVIIFRLGSVLGRKTGHQGPSRSGPFGQRASQEDSHKDMRKPIDSDGSQKDETAPPVEVAPQAEKDLDLLARREKDFDPGHFLSGARQAFDIIVNSYAQADYETLRLLLAPNVLANFEDVMKAREKAGETLEVNLVKIQSSRITKVDIQDRCVTITVIFVSEQISILRNSEGMVIEGDPEQAEQIEDIWAFKRDFSHKDPTWLLVCTETPESS